MKLGHCFLFMLVCALAFSSAASAQSIGINFTADVVPGSGFVSPSDLAPTQIAGVFPQGNWNNMVPDLNGSAGSLKDNSGATTTVSVDWNSGIEWGYQAGDTFNPNVRLLSNVLGATLDGIPNTVTLQNIPYDTYDIYVYVSSNAQISGRKGWVGIGGINYYYTSTSYIPFVQAFATTAATTAAANYGAWSGLSGATQTIEFAFVASGLVGVTGIQIVNTSPVPIEPTSWGELKSRF